MNETPVIEPMTRSAWWSVYHWGGWPPQSVFTDPPATYAEMRAIYPKAAGIIPGEDA